MSAFFRRFLLNIIQLNVSLRLFAALDAREREGVDVELGDAVGVADEPDELPLGWLKGGVGHHVQEANVKLPDVLRLGAGQLKEVLTFVGEFSEGGERRVSDQWHN